MQRGNETMRVRALRLIESTPYLEIIFAVVIGKLLTALHTINSRDDPNLAAVSQNKAIRSFAVVIDELRQRTVHPAIDIFTWSQLENPVRAAIHTTISLFVANKLAAVLDDLDAPRDISQGEDTLAMN
jgi:hypothetical protein